MADDSVNVNIDFTATNNTGRITDEMVRRAQQGAQQIEMAYASRMRAIADMAKRTGVTFEDMYKRSQTASANWATFENGLLLRREANLRKAQEQQASVGDEIDRTTEKTKKQTRATDEGANAIKKQTSAGNEAVSMLGRYAAGFFTVNQAIQLAQKSLVTFAEHERSLYRSATAIRLNKEEAEQLASSIKGLSRETGDSTAQLNDQFQRLAPSMGLYGKAAVDEFTKMRQAAHAMNADVGDVMAMRGMLTRLKVSTEEIPKVFDALATTLPAHLVGPFTKSVEQIMPTFDRLKIGGPKVILDMAAMYRASSADFADPNAGFGALSKAIESAFDPMTELGIRMQRSRAELKAGAIDMPAFLQRMNTEMEKSGAFSGSDVTKKLVRERIGLGDESFEAVNIYAKNNETMRAEQQKQAESEGTIAKRREELFKQQQAQNDALKGSLEDLYAASGKTLSAMAGPDAQKNLTTTIDLLAKYNEGIARIIFGLAAGRIDQTVKGVLAIRRESGAGGGTEAPAVPDAPTTRAAPFSSRRIPGRAAGGPMEKDQPYVVGEKGPEIVLPREPGQVLTADQSQRYGDVLAGQQGKADAELRSYLAGFRDKGRQMQRLAMLDDRPGALGELGGGGGGGGRGGRGGGGGDPAGGTRTGTGARGGDGSGTGDGKTGTPGVGDTPLNTPVGLDPASATGPAESLEEAYKRGYLVPPGGDGATYGLGDRSNKSIPASIRYNNPGAQWPSAESKRFGMTDQGVIGGGNKIAGFPTPVHGLASNIGLLNRKYVGMTVGAAIHKWSGGGRNSVPGFNSGAILTKEMAQDPKFWMAMHGAESGQSGGLSMKQIGQALEMYKSGSAAAYERANPEFMAANKGTAAAGGPGAPGATTVGGLKQALQGGVSGSAALDDALKIEGLHEVKDREAVKAYLGGWNPVGRDSAWCARFVNSALGHTGGKGTGSEVATSFLNWGQPVTEGGPKAGDVLVQAGGRGAGETGGHVGFATGRTRVVNGQLQYEMYSGNTGDKAQRDWRSASALTVRRGTEKELGNLPVPDTKVAGPAQISDVETRAAVRYKAAQEHAAAPVTSAGPSFTQRAHATHLARAAAARPYVAPAGEGRAAGKGKSARAVSAPGQEERAAGKRPAPVVRPVAAEGHEGSAAGKGLGPVEGKAAGGPIDAETPYMVGEEGPELITPSRSGNVTSNSNLQAMMQGMREQMERPIEPVIRPRFQHMGASSARWTRQAERSREIDNSRRAAREAHTDQGFA